MKTTAKIQMYRMGELGDCFLVTFTAGNLSSRLLIDCGSFRNGTPSKSRIKAVVDAIAEEVGDRGLDVVVGTHQHNDHVSGFVHSEAAFRRMGIDQVWLSWLDDPVDAQARQIGRDHNNLKLHLAEARDVLARQLKGKKGSRPLAARSLEVLNDVLGFYGSAAAGVPAKVPAEGVKILKEIGRKKPAYLRPGKILPMPGLPAGSVKIHVLGPPRNDELLYRKDPRSGESYDHALAAARLGAAKFLSALAGKNAESSAEELNYPFASRFKRPGPKYGSAALKSVVQDYKRAEADWRTIDEDWMTQAESLALYLDTFTNNSSLVLAIELVESRKILLFAADAQTGNWLSWDTVKWEDSAVRTDDLLKRTVFYKVGHHASHNATLIAGFEAMTDPDLVAFIPVDKSDANITKPKGGWKMPAAKLFKRLKAKTNNRVLQMDGVNPVECDPAREPAKSSWAAVGIKPKITDACVEIEVS